MTLTVLVADDQEMVRTGFALILDAQPDLHVVAVCADGISAIETARRLRPDVTLVDIRMPGLDGLEVTRALAGPGIAQPLRVVVVTTFDDDHYVDTALNNGALGFILKDAGAVLLVEAVRAAARGDALISPALTIRLLQRRQPRNPRSRYAAAAALSPRELEVVQAVAHGLTNTEICTQLFLSLGTVKTHLGSVQSKLGLTNRVQVAAWAWKHDLVRHQPSPGERTH